MSCATYSIVKPNTQNALEVTRSPTDPERTMYVPPKATSVDTLHIAVRCLYTYAHEEHLGREYHSPLKLIFRQKQNIDERK